jgi:hypothetical protein
MENAHTHDTHLFSAMITHSETLTRMNRSFLYNQNVKN